jgi:hypothetical protein
MEQYLEENEKPLVCEYTKDELNEYRKILREYGKTEEKIEEKISREIYEVKERLIRRYEDYLGKREDPGDKPVGVYRRWLRDVRACSDEEVDELSEREFSESSSENSSN